MKLHICYDLLYMNSENAMTKRVDCGKFYREIPVAERNGWNTVEDGFQAAQMNGRNADNLRGVPPVTAESADRALTEVFAVRQRRTEVVTRIIAFCPGI